MSSLVGHEQGKAIVEEYDVKSLFSMLLMCHYHVHPLDEYERGIVDQRVEEDGTLNIFEMTTNISELATELINRELLIFKCYHVVVKNIKCQL
jgi:hypothetical protein